MAEVVQQLVGAATQLLQMQMVMADQVAQDFIQTSLVQIITTVEAVVEAVAAQEIAPLGNKFLR